MIHRLEKLYGRFCAWLDSLFVMDASDDPLMSDGVLGRMPKPTAETPSGYQGTNPVLRTVWENGQAGIGHISETTGGTRRVSLARVMKLIGIPVSRQNARTVYSALIASGFIRGYVKPANYREKRRFVLATA